MSNSPIVGIDLGTSYSAIARYHKGRLEFFKNELGETLTPSAVAYDEGSGGLVCGRLAKDIAATRPSLAAVAFKRDMGSERKYRLGPHELSPVELSSYVLDTLRADAERNLGCAITRCVLTVPAYFNEAQRAATKQAAELAGLNVERMINEPTAAALAHGLNENRDESSYLVFDLGGGTFDVSVVELFEGMLQVKGVAGESRLGGEDFTEALLELLLGRANVSPEAAKQASPEAYALCLKRAEMLKRKLARWPSADLRLPAIAGLLEETRLEVTQSEADAAYRGLLERMKAPCFSALRGAELSTDDLDEIILVGGATRLKCVSQFVREVLGREPRIDPEPDFVVARGAAIQAALVSDDEGVEDVVITDVASHSLGVEVVREIGGKHLEGYYMPVLHRNTVVPCSRVESISPVHAHQKTLTISVFEGEARRISENRHVGDLKLTGLPKSGDRSVDVRFTYDLNGLLEVEACIVQTGKSVSAIFEREAMDLSDEERERATERLQRLKADPQKRPRYRDLLSRANLLWQELDPLGQSALAANIDEFEAALAGHNPEEMESAYFELSAACQKLDDGERF